MSDDELDLLLANPRDFTPVLNQGLGSAAVLGAPKPKKDAAHFNASHLLRDRRAERADTTKQRWGIVAPEGNDGDALLEAIKPLIELRADEQGADPMVFRVKPNLDRNASRDWLFNVYESERIEERERPLYLCLLGGPNHVSFDFQQTIIHSSYVGRVHFDKNDGSLDVDAYAAYAAKVVKYACEGFTKEPPELLYYVAPDGSRATQNAVPKLVMPSRQASLRAIEKGRFSAVIRQVEANSVDNFLASSSAPADAPARPSVLLSVSHGLGGSAEDFGSRDAQRRRQGAMVLGPKEILDADALAGKTFLPGGLWFFFACFGAGTPASSEYRIWLDELAKQNVYRDSVDAVMRSLDLSGNGFLAALPQAALRNPNGPLAVVGHVDLAWNFAYLNPDDPKESRSAKFTRALHAMAEGSRVGSAHDEIIEWYRVMNDNLAAMYGAGDDARAGNRPNPIDPVKLGQTWLTRNDLRGYVLLGDPAVRLPQAEPEVRPPRKARQAAVPEVHTSATLSREDAIQALLDGNESPRSIAQRAGVTHEKLFDWFDEYRAMEKAKRG